MSSTWADVAKAVTGRRLDLDITQQQAAAASGLSATTWQKLESRHEAPNDRSLRRMAKVLRWPPDALDRLMAGEDPATFDDPDPTSPAGAGVVEREPIGLAAKAGKLSPEARAKLEGYLDALLDEDA